MPTLLGKLHRPSAPLLLVLALLLVLLPAIPASAEDAPARTEWPQFRGPARDGVSAETGLVRSFPEDGPEECWRRPLGEGFSAVTVADGGLFTLYADAEHELAVRLDPATGETVWGTPIGPRFDEPLGNGPRSTPAWDGKQLFVLSSTGDFHALDPADGEILWTVDAQEELGAAMPVRGFTSSPVVDGSTVIVELGAGEGKGVIAFDRASGEVAWSARDTQAGHASLLPVTIDGVHQLIHLASAGRELAALKPGGEIYWTHPWPPGAIAMPVFIPPNRIFVSASADTGAMVVEVSQENGKPKVEEIWRSRVMKNHFSTSVVHEGTIYGFDNGTLKAVDAATGEQLWAARGLGKGSLIVADGLLVLLSDRGELVFAEATREDYRPLAEARVLSGKTWTMPTLADGRLYLRDHSQIVCLEVGS